MVAPPSVLTALAILHGAEGAARGDKEDLAEVREHAQRWLPWRLYAELFPLRWVIWKRLPPTFAVAELTKIIQLGAPEPPEEEEEPRRRRGAPEKKKLTPEEALQRFLRSDWALHVAEVAHHFTMSPSAVLDMPWPLFHLMLQKAHAMRARWQIDYMGAKSLPYIEKDQDRDKAFTALQKRAGYVEEKTREEKLAEQRENLIALKQQWARRFSR